MCGISATARPASKPSATGQPATRPTILDSIIDKLVRQIFERMKAVPKSEIVSVRYQEKMEERKICCSLSGGLQQGRRRPGDAERGGHQGDPRGKRIFSQDLLGSLIAEAEAKCHGTETHLDAAQAAYDEGQAVLASLNAQYDDIISWSEMYDTASIEAKKMIVNCLDQAGGGLPGLQAAY